ncbi:MAG: hypothetical protein IJT82_05560 [Schwartzia sp.]|nr:hypothetical protein [Schwartzia sp. (in: firmicutes)]
MIALRTKLTAVLIMLLVLLSTTAFANPYPAALDNGQKKRLPMKIFSFMRQPLFIARASFKIAYHSVA